jgi:hypothetical protein
MPHRAAVSAQIDGDLSLLTVAKDHVHGVGQGVYKAMLLPVRMRRRADGQIEAMSGSCALRGNISTRVR